MDYDKNLKDMPQPGEKIHDLVDVVEKGFSEKTAVKDLPDQQREMFVREIRDVAERIARELVPAIAERVIREEIEKLKKVGG